MNDFVKAFDAENRILFSVRPAEANVIIGCGWAEWRGRKRDTLRVFVSKPALVEFVRMMRFKPIPTASGEDSTTTKKQAGTIGWKFIPERTEAYSAAARMETGKYAMPEEKAA